MPEVGACVEYVLGARTKENICLGMRNSVLSKVTKDDQVSVLCKEIWNEPGASGYIYRLAPLLKPFNKSSLVPKLAT